MSKTTHFIALTLRLKQLKRKLPQSPLILNQNNKIIQKYFFCNLTESSVQKLQNRPRVRRQTPPAYPADKMGIVREQSFKIQRTECFLPPDKGSEFTIWPFRPSAAPLTSSPAGHPQWICKLIPAGDGEGGGGRGGGCRPQTSDVREKDTTVDRHAASLCIQSQLNIYRQYSQTYIRVFFIFLMKVLS